MNRQNDNKNFLREALKLQISREVTRIVSIFPFVGRYLLECRFLYDHPGVPVAATDGKNIFINTYAFAKFDGITIGFLLVHEVLHIMLLSHLRMLNKFGSYPGQEEFEKWNRACDYEINRLIAVEFSLRGSTVTKVESIIKDNGWCYDIQYDKLSAETIFNKMPESSGKSNDNNYYPVNVGDVICTKNDKYGTVSQINVDGTYEIEELSFEEAMKLI